MNSTHTNMNQKQQYKETNKSNKYTVTQIKQHKLTHAHTHTTIAQNYKHETQTEIITNKQKRNKNNKIENDNIMKHAQRNSKTRETQQQHKRKQS